jgi:hypothetical protein
MEAETASEALAYIYQATRSSLKGSYVKIGHYLNICLNPERTS